VVSVQRELLQALAAIADLKQENYRLWLSLSTLTEALIAHGIISRTELYELSTSLEAADTVAALRQPAHHPAPLRLPTSPGDEAARIHDGASSP
jgi:hypothetical protein